MQKKLHLRCFTGFWIHLRFCSRYQKLIQSKIIFHKMNYMKLNAFYKTCRSLSKLMNHQNLNVADYFTRSVGYCWSQRRHSMGNIGNWQQCKVKFRSILAFFSWNKLNLNISENSERKRSFYILLLLACSRFLNNPI